MSVKIINKNTKPEGHIGTRRWIKYIARNEPLVKVVKEPRKYMHASRTNIWARN